jgi:hypothetical protein
LKIIQPATSNYSNLQTSISSLSTTTEEHGSTNFQYAIGNKLTAMIPPTGFGKNANDRLVKVMIVTDGVEDSNYVLQPATDFKSTKDSNFTMWMTAESPTWGVDGEPINNEIDVTLQSVNPVACNGIKATGAQVFVLNVNYPYLPWVSDEDEGMGGDPGFKQIADYITPNLSSTVGKCASTPKQFKTANKSEDIEDVITKMFSDVLGAPGQTRITN